MRTAPLILAASGALWREWWVRAGGAELSLGAQTGGGRGACHAHLGGLQTMPGHRHGCRTCAGYVCKAARWRARAQRDVRRGAFWSKFAARFEVPDDAPRAPACSSSIAKQRKSKLEALWTNQNGLRPGGAVWREWWVREGGKRGEFGSANGCKSCARHEHFWELCAMPVHGDGCGAWPGCVSKAAKWRADVMGREA